MPIKKYILVLLVITLNLFGRTPLEQPNEPNDKDNAYGSKNDILCPTKKTCKDMKNKCQCWCSHKCGPREKEEDDAPVYVNDDPYGNYCYCKQWDLDNVGRCKAKTKK